MKTFNSEELNGLLEQHKLWLSDSAKGKRADLKDADLRNANLIDANLSNVNLNGCIGNGSEIQSIQTTKYLININKEDIQIGCERHTIETWLSFSDNVIQDMDRGALDWWKMYKPIITALLNVKLG